MKFKLEIELGNDSMRTPADVEYALSQVGAHMANYNNAPFTEVLKRGWPSIRKLQDVNGNTVGEWRIVLS